MASHGRLRVLAVALVGLLSHAPARLAAQEALPQTRVMQEDAELCDVQFVDAERGWAVGDRGTIWHTADGGKSWALQSSGVTCRLTSVSFVDAEHGWVVGGATQPYTHTSRGVLLVTRDGGHSWKADRSLVLPSLRKVKFFDRANGWALGDFSASLASGVFSTDDGGRSWSPMSSQGASGWLTGDMVDPLTGAVAGRRGAIAVVRRKALDATRTPELGLRGVQNIRLTSSGAGWLVGDGGLVLSTADSAQNWGSPTTDPAQVVGSGFDWRALDVRGTKCWIVGEPGSRVLHTADGGQTWQTFATGSHVPLHAIHFADDNQGWAVGALGTILRTADGGRTWQRQHSGGTRAAILALVSEPRSAPLEFFARLAGNEGYLSAIEFLNRRDLENPNETTDSLDARADDAMTLVGGSSAETAWAFPLRQAGLALSTQQILDGWNRANDGQAAERLEAHLVRQIRMWRPEVIVTHASSPRGNDPLGHLVNQFVLRAADRAADATRLPEHLSQQGLEPWRVKKVLGYLGDGQAGQLNITTSQLAPRMGRSLAELADEARSLVADGYTAAPSTLGFQIAIDALPQSSGSHDFMAGLTLYPGGEARRKLADTPEQGVELMRRVAQKHRNVQAILARAEHGPSERRALGAQVGDLTMGLDEGSSGDVLFHMAHHYWQTGRWDAAAEMFQMLATRYPQHRLAAPSLVWLASYWSSGEIGWQIERASRAGAVEAELPTAAVVAAPGRTAAAAQQAAGQNLRTKRTVGLVADIPNDTQRSERASGICRQMGEQHPSLFAEPNLQFIWSAAQRKAGFPVTGDRIFAMMARSRSRDAWWTCAAGELWLAEPSKSSPPKQVWRVIGTAQRPYLDGRLDEPMWQDAAPAELRSPLGDDGSWPAEALAAYDGEFLYVAVRCRKAKGIEYRAAGEARPRDPDLTKQDRVELLVDIDRDYATYYRLVVDHRGWAAEDCWADKSWNPSWYVASHVDETSWSVEAAIPLEMLTPKRPEPRDIWCVGIQRIVPEAGFQSWTTPAGVAVTGEGFGYLLFQ